MSEINDGGPAFPVEVYDFDKDAFVNEKGMTLRDYFAAKAMPTMLDGNGVKITKAHYISRGLDVGDFHGLVARCAYELADRMLEARKCDD
ncbi:MAG TPA: hypothetical protein DCY52_08705 [Methylococcaceae bacterium]|jgi:hypothetical protein|nr:hypothetical protein [Methylococcaceae bacterium]